MVLVQSPTKVLSCPWTLWMCYLWIWSRREGESFSGISAVEGMGCYQSHESFLPASNSQDERVLSWWKGHDFCGCLVYLETKSHAALMRRKQKSTFSFLYSHIFSTNMHFNCLAFFSLFFFFCDKNCIGSPVLPVYLSRLSTSHRGYTLTVSMPG